MPRGKKIRPPSRAAGQKPSRAKAASSAPSAFHKPTVSSALDRFDDQSSRGREWLRKLSTNQLESEKEARVSGADLLGLLGPSLDYSRPLTKIRELVGHREHISCITRSADSELVTASFDRKVKIWDLETGECKQTFEGNKERILRVAVAPDRSIVTKDDRGQVQVWDRATAECLHSFRVDRFGGLEVTADGHLVTPEGVWKVTGERIIFFDGHDVRGMLLLKGDLLVTGSKDSSLTLWNLGTGQPLRNFPGPGLGIITEIAQDLGGDLIAVTGSGALIKWRTDTGECIRRFDAHERPAWCVSVAPNGVVLTADADGQVKLWNPDLTKVIKMIPSKNGPWVGGGGATFFLPDGSIVRGGTNTPEIWAPGEDSQAAGSTEGN
jgi:WD40 repeat protein